MALQESTIKPIALEQKLNTYADFLENHLNALASDPTFTLDSSVKNINKLFEQTLVFIRDNEIMTTPTVLPRNAKFGSDMYNDLMDSANIDLQVAFARLRATIKVVNKTASLIDSRCKGLLDRIDLMLDKVASLRNLKTLNDDFDRSIQETFIQDNNRFYDNDYKTLHHEAGGIITLKETFSDAIIREEANFDLFIEPLHRNAVKRDHFKKMTSKNMIDASDISLYSYDNLYLRNYAVGQTAEYEDVILNYDGAVLAYILRLPAVKFINNISMKFCSAGLTDVIDIYYTKQSATNILDFPWTKVNYVIDKNNIRGATINFPTIEAGAIMVVVGQKSLTRTQVEAKKGLAYIESVEKYDPKQLIDNIQQKINVVARNKITEYVKPSVAKTLSEDTRVMINALIAELDQMIPPLNANRELPEVTEQTQFTEILEYNFSIFDLQVNYIHFFTGSTYQSENYGGNGNIRDIVLSANGNIPSGTIINHYIELANGEHRILPAGESNAIDIITVIDRTVKSYNTELLIDATKDVSVLINNTAVNPIYFSVVKPYATSTVGIGISLSPGIVLNFGDSIEIQYTVPNKTAFDRSYTPDNISISRSFGNPSLINQNLSYGVTERFLTRNRNGSLSAYEIPDEGSRKLYPVSGETVTPEVGFEIISGFVKSDLNTIFPPYDLTDIGYAISGEYAAFGSRNIYYGIIDEPIVANNECIFHTAEPYIPGSLHVVYSGALIPIIEYETDVVGYSTTSKTEFTTCATAGNITGTLLVSYIPTDIDSENQTSNIANKNMSEIFQRTDENAIIELALNPYVDQYIVRSIFNAAPLWSFSLGKFVNTYDESVVYEPISIRIAGREIVNKTEYVTRSEPILSEFTGENYEYYVKGKNIHFNTVITQAIDVRYYSLNDNFRYKAKLYRVDRKVDDITPELYGFTLFINEKD